MQPYWNERKVLVTGATGFLGAQLTNSLLQQGASVHVFTRPQSQLFRLEPMLERLKVWEADLIDSTAVARQLRLANPSVIFHLGAAGVSTQLPGDVLMNANANGTLNLVNAAVDLAVDRFVYVGSCGEYGDGESITEDVAPRPSNLYGASKVAGHLIAHAVGMSSNLPVVTVRPFATYGPAMPTSRLISYAIVSALEGRDIMLRSSSHKRDYTYADDLIEGLLSVGATPGIEGETINLCSGEGRSAEEITTKILDILGHPVKFHPGSVPLRSGEMHNQFGSNEKARRLLGWTPKTPLADGLAKTIDWYKQNMRLTKVLAEV